MRSKPYTAPIIYFLLGAFIASLHASAQDRNPQNPRLVWAAKPTPPTLYEPPNQLIWRLSEILDAHKGQASWRLPVVKTRDFEGKRVFAGGDNSIAVFSINQETGEPTLIQNADTHGFGLRTFSLDASGKILVVANQSAVPIRSGQSVSVVAAGLSVFRVGDDGKLDFVHKYDIETSNTKPLFWTGFVSLP